MRLLPGLFCAVVALSGCRFADPPPPPAWEEALASETQLGDAQAPALPYRLAVLPVEVAFDPLARYLGEEDATRHASVPDLDAFRQEVVKALEAAQLFRRVEARGGPSSVDPVGEAWEASDDLVLELVLRDYHQEYLEHTNFAWWFANYVLWVWPSWFVPVDHYGVGLELEVRLRSVQAGSAPLLTEEFQVRPIEVPVEFTPMDRHLAGFLDVGALWNVYTSLDEENWEAIDRHAGPHALRRALLQVLRSVEKSVARPLRSEATDAQERVLQKVRKRFAVVAGVTDYADPQLTAAPYGVADAEAMADLCAQPAGGALVVGRDLLRLTGEQATREGVLAALETVGRRASASDELLLYVAALGTTLPGEEGGTPALLLHDSRADALAETALSLEALGDALRATDLQRVVVVLDASFSRTAAGARSLGEVDWAGPVQSALGPLRPGWSLLLAAEPSQAAHVLPGADAGLFTQALRAGIGGEADADRDGRVSVHELYDYVHRTVAGRSGMEGFDQAPVGVGVEQIEKGFAWPN